MGKGMAKGWRAMVDLDRITHKGTGYSDRYFKVLLLARAGVNPQES
jgi:hypothetical protein